MKIINKISENQHEVPVETMTLFMNNPHFVGRKFSTQNINFFRVLFSTFGLLLIASTIYDLRVIKRNGESRFLIRKKKQCHDLHNNFSVETFIRIYMKSFFCFELAEDPNKLFVAFSVYTNGKAFFDITRSRNSNVIHCLNGIRALSIFWIILGHRLDERFMIPAINGDEVLSFPEKPISLIHTNFTLAVDTFFVMGGLLVTWSFLNALDKSVTITTINSYFS